MIVDEVQKLGDGLRGVVLQDAIERVARSNPNSRLIFLSPMTDNPEVMVQDAPPDLPTAVVPSEIPTVTQNLIMAEQLPIRSDTWRLLLRRDGKSESLGNIVLHARPDTQMKRLSFVALAVGREQAGTLVYANGAAEAEKIAWQICDGLGGSHRVGEDLDPELEDLSAFARDTIHPEFQLVELVKRGVAFHYGNMPTLLRSEIERLFKEGKLRFLVCTSTLVKGVNLACRTIVIRGPKKGKASPMGPHDFWNLAGRAGRWGQDFNGNIVCVDVNRQDLWPSGVPNRTRYPINRETEVVLAKREQMLHYLSTRHTLPTTALVPALEQVAAYLLAWSAREGGFANAPAASRLPAEYVRELDGMLLALLKRVDVPSEIISRHPGVSAVALQSLLNYFRKRKKPVRELIPATPDSDDAYPRLIAAFRRINGHLYPAFLPTAAIPVHALVTIEWMKGLPLGQIIQKRIRYLKDHHRDFNLAAVIRDTMRDVEETARFRAPKFLAAYLDVLKLYLEEIGEINLFPQNLRFDLYLEFGVATETLLSLIGLGLSRTAAIALNEYLTNDRLSEESVLQWLRTNAWRTFDIPAVAKREIDNVLQKRTKLIA